MAFNKEKVMDAARRFVDKGQIDKAVKEYLRIVHEDPKDVRVWLKIGDLYAKKGSKQDAIETYLKVARFYHDQGFFHKAVAVYNQIHKLDPRLVDVILKLAELYRQLNLMSEAMQHFELVAAHFHREGNTKEALATVKKLVDLDPENIATRIKLAELYSKEGLIEDAAVQFGVACDQLRRQGRQDDFLKVAERLLWHKPDNHALNRELAGLYLRRNDPRRALQKLQACFKADPRDVETLGLLAQAFQALDQKAKTVSVLKELARVHLENKHRERASDVYRKIMEFVPNDADAVQFLGAAQPAPAAAARAVSPPPSRVASPLPSPVRALSHEAKFGITDDLPALPRAPSMTGSMPLVDDQSLSEVDFAMPEYDDGDFSADMEPAPDPRQVSAAGELHAEEIARTLAETEVYLNYGLHQKAVERLRHVFTLDPENFEAHERLKDIFLAQGRAQEAEVELLKLAELIAPVDPDRAETYLQELFAMEGTHTGAFELARRFRLRVSRLSSVPPDVDVELDDLDLVSGPVVTPRPTAEHRLGHARGRDSIDEFDPDELIHGRVANGSPAQMRLPQPPPFDQPTDNFELEFEMSPSTSTRQMAPGHVEALHHEADDLDDALLGVPNGQPQRWSEQELRDAVERQLDDSIADDIDHEVAAELATSERDDLPFDPDEARAFDRAVAARAPATDPVAAVVASSFDEVSDVLSVAGGYDPYHTDALQAPFDPTAANIVDPAISATDAEARGDGQLEDELDEADFYIGQSMYSEAIDVLRALLARYPSHRLLHTKLRDVEALAAGGVEDIGQAIDDSIVEEVGAEAIEHESAATDAIDLDEIEEVNVDDIEELPESAPIKKRGPTVMLEKPVDDGDADTHYDLGLAYKEMGLHDEAIKAFEKTLRSQAREVQCRLMIGMCYRDMGNPSEAIQQFKQGLHAEPSERERQSLYYDIGITYEAIGDLGEALYYFEMVAKRDPYFADTAARITAIRARGPRPRTIDDDI